MTTDNPLSDGTPIDFSQISPKQAGEALARMTADYAKGNPADPLRMSPERATASLEQMAKGAKSSEVDPIGAALKGELKTDVMTTSPADAPMLSPYKLNETVGALRSIGFPDSGVEFILRNKTVTAADVVWARGVKDRMLTDPEFVKRYLGGTPADRHYMAGLDYILSADIAG